MDLYDRYCFYVKNMVQGFVVPYERFIQILYDMGVVRKQVRDHHGTMVRAATGVKVTA